LLERTQRVAICDHIAGWAVQQENVNVVGIETPETGFGRRAQIPIREILRQSRLAGHRYVTTCAIASAYPWRQDALERFGKTHPRREVLPGLGRNGDILAPCLKGHSKNSLAFALAVDIRCIEEADASFVCCANQLRGVSLVGAENGAEPGTAKPKP